MSQDPYSPCVCGSGKKLKFCCQDILSEMIRVEKLVENQPDAAEKLLRQLLTKHSDKEVVVTRLSGILVNKGEYQEARTLLVDFLKAQPDEPRALLALADVCLNTDGFGSSRRIIHRAFQLGSRQYPRSVASLAVQIAQEMARRGCAMSVREHLALSIRLSEGEYRNSLMMQLANFESQRTIPYPFRGRLSLLPVEVSEDLQKDEAVARKVSQIGCWEPASIIYRRLLEKDPNNGALWFNLGLFHAWDGQLESAAKAMHRAAELIEEFDGAVEAETLAELIEMDLSTDTYGVAQHRIPVQSVSELLTVLDDAELLARVEDPEEEGFENGRVAAEYEFLSEALGDEPDPNSLPAVKGDITIVDSDDEAHRVALVVALDDDVDEVAAAFREAAGDLAAAAEEGAEATHLSRLPVECRPFDWKVHHINKLGGAHYRAIDQTRLTAAVEEWKQAAQGRLDNQAPADAAKDEANHRKVCASIFVLGVVANRMGYDPDLAQLRSDLGVPAPAALDVDENVNLTSLPMLQFERVADSELTDAQVVEFANRITLIGHRRLLGKALELLVSRQASLEEFSPMRAHLLRANTARENNDFELASECFEQARKSVADDPDSFRTKLELDIREFSCRLDRPDDPALPDLLASLRDRYFLKIPEIEEVIREELLSSSCEHLLEILEAAPSASGTLWTPGQADPPPEGEKSKLWVPGQD